MKKTYNLLAGFLIICTVASAQHFREVQPLDLSDSYLGICDRSDGEIRNNPGLILKELDEMMPEITTPFERYQLYLWYYAPALDELQRYDDLLSMLNKAQSEGFSFMIRTGERPWPRWVPELDRLDGFGDFLARNDAMIENEQGKTPAEYFVKLPEDYRKGETYPLFVVIHGGVGSHYSSSQYWVGGENHSKFITAYLQGAQVVGTFQRRFNNESLENIHDMIADVKTKYPVDESRMIIGGPSAGGYRTLLLGCDEQEQASGLLLAFPVVPRDISEEMIQTLSAKKLKVALITGEHDGGVVRQKDLCVRFDEAGIPNRLLIFPEKGHEYPDNFSHHLDTSLEFLLKEQNEEMIE